MTHLVLVRHGQTDWNLEGRYQGQTELPLNETGRSQARKLAEQLAGQLFEAVYSSDLRRAHETASIIAEKLGLAVQLEPRLREVNLGEWEGMLVGDIITCRPAEWEQRQRDPVYTHPPGGESLAEVAGRVRAAADVIARRYPAGPVLLVSHGLATAALLCQARQISLDKAFGLKLENGSVEEIDWIPE